MRRGFKVANNTESRVKDPITNAKTPLADKNSQVAYIIPCKCKENAYNGETDRMWESRKKEHQDKVRLTLQDAETGDIDKATERTNTGDGGLAKHILTTGHEVDWDNAKIVGRERRWTQRRSTGKESNLFAKRTTESSHSTHITNSNNGSQPFTTFSKITDNLIVCAVSVLMHGDGI